jgi:hydrogenase nickel incorporation protein HypB
MSIITVERKILEKNDETAGVNRELYAKHGTVALNLLSSPGSGKTSLLERTIEHLRHCCSMAVVEGDLQTTLDAKRVEKYGIPVVQIVTNGSCHLDAGLVREAVMNMDLTGVGLLFIENVGNLVCPANYDLGESHKVVILSTTEGEDKPLKYPAMFHRAQVLVINKIDLLPHLPMSLAAMKKNALTVNPRLKIFEVSCTTGSGIPGWCEWLVSLTSLVGVKAGR